VKSSSSPQFSFWVSVALASGLSGHRWPVAVCGTQTIALLGTRVAGIGADDIGTRCLTNNTRAPLQSSHPRAYVYVRVFHQFHSGATISVVGLVEDMLVHGIPKGASEAGASSGIS